MAPISETFLSFLDPLFHDIPEDFTEDDIQGIVKLGFISWNAVTLETAHGDDQFIEKVLKGQEGEILEKFKMMMERKKQEFNDDHRMLGQYKVSLMGGDNIELEMSVVDGSYYNNQD